MRIFRYTRSAATLFLLALVGAASFTQPFARPGGTTTAPATTQPGAQEPTFTVHVHDKTRDQVLAQFGRAVNVRFAHPAPGFWTQGESPAAKVSLNIVNQPFWAALSHLQDATDLGFVADNNGEHITPTHQHGDWGWTGRPEAICGPMLLSVRQVNRQTTVPFNDPGEAFDQITLVVQGWMRPGSDWQVDDNGLEMSSLRTDGGLELQRGESIHAGSQRIGGGNRCTFTAFAPTGVKIAWVTLGGQVHCSGASSHETFKMDNAETQTLDRKVDGYDVHLATQRTGRAIQVKITAKLPEAVDFGAVFAVQRRLSTLWGKGLKLIDANGIEMVSRPGFPAPSSAMPWGMRMGMRRRPTTGPNGLPVFVRPKVDHVDILTDFTPVDAPGPFKLEWTVPSTLDDVSFPMQIEEIPVP